MKKVIVIFIVLLFLSCNSVGNKYFSTLKGEWEIVKFYHKDKDLMLEEFYKIGFDTKSNLWLIKNTTGKSHFISSNFKIYKDSSTLKMELKNCKDIRLNGNYDLYIDTIQKNEEDYVLRLILDRKNTYFQAIRSKLIYHNYDEFINHKTGN